VKKIAQTTDELCDQSVTLSQLLQLLAGKSDGVARHFDSGPFLLSRDEHGLALHADAASKAGATRVDFADATLQYRLKTSGKRQGLGKAVGLDKAGAGQIVSVVDATAGLGRDAFVLAHLGCRVVMLEQSPVIHALLADGLERGRQQPALLDALSRMQLHHVESRQWLAAMAERGEHCDVVYLDPMFPPRDKSAKVKKDIALLHDLLGSEPDLASLVEVARKVARYRVVLKRPDARLPDGVPEPTLWLGEKPAAFAIYVNSSFSNMR
jgi:16S rRNA (guanine1516-N2)-methyltransferase